MITSCGSDETASRIVIGTGQVINEYTEQQYQMPFSVQVSDINGMGVNNQEVNVSVQPSSYTKGYWQLNAGGDEWETVQLIDCSNEDSNRNGVLETGEDINSNGKLDPTNPVTIGPHPSDTPTLVNGKLVTNEYGSASFSIIYPKTESQWVTVKLTASTKVTGSESSDSITFKLLSSLTDMQSVVTVPPGGTYTSKYGSTSASCLNDL
ncbi:MAG: hypothetical protein OQK72_00130 [Gammaproteobacteria bacterium]|nr:hypothetical protein [Gammaproteobacteria bacterium]MCW9005167.1 hypothetical protein [Gammaproteobacteria bacterium]MCW9057197.1 hypothetical protein [Gammaproteobacteria bacterium]